MDEFGYDKLEEAVFKDLKRSIAESGKRAVKQGIAEVMLEKIKLDKINIDSKSLSKYLNDVINNAFEGVTIKAKKPKGKVANFISMKDSDLMSALNTYASNPDVGDKIYKEFIQAYAVAKDRNLKISNKINDFYKDTIEFLGDYAVNAEKKVSTQLTNFKLDDMLNDAVNSYIDNMKIKPAKTATKVKTKPKKVKEFKETGYLFDMYGNYFGDEFVGTEEHISGKIIREALNKTEQKVDTILHRHNTGIAAASDDDLQLAIAAAQEGINSVLIEGVKEISRLNISEIEKDDRNMILENFKIALNEVNKQLSPGGEMQERLSKEGKEVTEEIYQAVVKNTLQKILEDFDYDIDNVYPTIEKTSGMTKKDIQQTFLVKEYETKLKQAEELKYNIGNATPNSKMYEKLEDALDDIIFKYTELDDLIDSIDSKITADSIIKSGKLEDIAFKKINAESIVSESEVEIKEIKDEIKAKQEIVKINKEIANTEDVISKIKAKAKEDRTPEEREILRKSIVSKFPKGSLSVAIDDDKADEIKTETEKAVATSSSIIENLKKLYENFEEMAFGGEEVYSEDKLNYFKELQKTLASLVNTDLSKVDLTENVSLDKFGNKIVKITEDMNQLFQEVHNLGEINETTGAYNVFEGKDEEYKQIYRDINSIFELLDIAKSKDITNIVSEHVVENVEKLVEVENKQVESTQSIAAAEDEYVETTKEAVEVNEEMSNSVQEISETKDEETKAIIDVSSATDEEIKAKRKSVKIDKEYLETVAAANPKIQEQTKRLEELNAQIAINEKQIAKYDKAIDASNYQSIMSGALKNAQDMTQEEIFAKVQELINSIDFGTSTKKINKVYGEASAYLKSYSDKGGKLSSGISIDKSGVDLTKTLEEYYNAFSNLETYGVEALKRSRNVIANQTLELREEVKNAEANIKAIKKEIKGTLKADELKKIGNTQQENERLQHRLDAIAKKALEAKEKIEDLNKTQKKYQGYVSDYGYVDANNVVENKSSLSDALLKEQETVKDISKSEIGDLNLLKDAVDKVTDAVKNKTSAFVEEGKVVNKVITLEQSKVEDLVKKSKTSKTNTTSSKDEPDNINDIWNKAIVENAVFGKMLDDNYVKNASAGWKIYFEEMSKGSPILKKMGEYYKQLEMDSKAVESERVNNNNEAWKKYFQTLTEKSPVLSEMAEYYKQQEKEMSRLYKDWNAAIKEDKRRNREIISNKVNDNSRVNFIANTAKWLRDNTAITVAANQKIREYINDIQNADDKGAFEELRKKIIKIQTEEINAGRAHESFADKLKRSWVNLSRYLLSTQSFYRVISMIRTATNEVINLDTQITELRKVSDATETQLSEAFVESTKTAKELGNTISDVIKITSDWARLGYGIEDAEKLAKVTSMFVTIGDNMTSDSASSYLISTLQGFQKDADEALSIVDKYNEVANNFAIDTAGIGEALQNSAASFNAASTDLSEAIALVTTANAVAQNPSSVGNAFKTLSARIRGAKSELEDLGEETDSYVETTSKLRDLTKSLTGFDILKDDQKTFKSIYEIMLGIGKEWDKLTDVERASLGEALAGKRNSNIFFAVMNNIDDLERAYATAENSAGSAQREHENYMKSVQYSIDVMKASVQEFYATLINSGDLKALIDGGSTLINGLNSIVSKTGAITLLINGLSAFAGFKDFNFGGNIKGINKLFPEIEKPNVDIIKAYNKELESLSNEEDIISASSEIMNRYLEKTTGITNKLIKESKGAAVAQDALNQANDKVALSTKALAVAQNLLVSAAITIAIHSIAKAWDEVNVTVAELNEQIEITESKIASLTDEIKSLEEENGNQRKIEQLKERLELEEKILEAKKAQQLAEKFGTKFTDYFDKDSYAYYFTKENQFDKTAGDEWISKANSFTAYANSLVTEKSKLQVQNGRVDFSQEISLDESEISKAEEKLREMENSLLEYRQVYLELTEAINSGDLTIAETTKAKEYRDQAAKWANQVKEAINIVKGQINQSDVESAYTIQGIKKDGQYYFNLDKSINDYIKNSLSEEELEIAIGLDPMSFDTIDQYIAYVRKKAHVTSKELSKSIFTEETNSHIDDFQKKVSTLKSALESIQSGSMNSEGLIDLQQEFNDLDIDAENLEDQLKSLIDSALKELFKYLGTNIPSELQDSLEKIAATAKGIYPDLNTSFNKIQSSWSIIEDWKNAISNGGLTDSLMSSIAGLDDNMANLVAQFYAGRVSADELYNALTEHYKTDLKNYTKALIGKNAFSEEFYNAVGLMNAEFINDFKDKYNYDLTNCKNYNKAKISIEEQTIKALGRMWSVYYDSTNNTLSDKGKLLEQQLSSPDISADQKKYAAETIAEIYRIINQRKSAEEALEKAAYNGLGDVEAQFEKISSSLKGNDKNSSSSENIFDWAEQSLSNLERELTTYQNKLNDTNLSWEEQLKTLKNIVKVQNKLDKFYSGYTEEMRSRYEKELNDLSPSQRRKYKDYIEGTKELRREDFSNEKLYKEVSEAAETYKSWQESLQAETESRLATIEAEKSLLDAQIDRKNSYYSYRNSIISEYEEKLEHGTANESDISKLEELYKKQVSNRQITLKLEEDKLKYVEKGTQAYAEQSEKVEQIREDLEAVTENYASIGIKLLQQITDELEEQKEIIDETLEEYDEAISGVNYIIEEQVKSLEKAREKAVEPLNKELEMLQKSHDEMDKILAIQKAQYELEKTRNQKTRRVMRDGQWQYEQDDEAVRSAQDNYDSAIYEKRVYDLQSAINKIEESYELQIKTLNDWLDRFQTAVSSWDNQQLVEAAEVLLGVSKDGIIAAASNGYDGIYTEFVDTQNNIKDAGHVLDERIKDNTKSIEKAQKIIDSNITENANELREKVDEVLGNNSTISQNVLTSTTDLNNLLSGQTTINSTISNKIDEVVSAIKEKESSSSNIIIAGNSSSTLIGQATQTAANAISQALDKIKTKSKANGGVINPSMAKGGINKLKDTVLTAEEGAEIVVHKKDGVAELVTKPSYQDLQNGDIVFNAEQTKKILKQSDGSSIIPLSFASPLMLDKISKIDMPNVKMPNINSIKTESTTNLHVDNIVLPNVTNQNDAQLIVEALCNLSNETIQVKHRR